MFNKKFPLKQPPPQVYQQQSQEQSQPLIQEVDPNYEPTQKQVRQYAIQTLGMKLPEDQSLLYLARQGLKAPITPNWVPYQSRNGQIYYKHNITQQKTYDHPTDTQYRKKYQQFKEKAARKNLKSISMKQNMAMQGLLPSNSKSILGSINNNSGIGSHFQNVSGISMGQNITEPTIDDQLIAQLEKDLNQYEKRQQKLWKQFQQEAEDQHNKRLKKIKQQHEQQRNRIQGKSTAKKNQSRILQQQQNRLQKSLEQAEESSLKQQMRLLRKQQQNKLLQYRAVFQQDNNLKLRKMQIQYQQNYKQKSRLLQEKINNLQIKQQQQKQNRAIALKQARAQLQKPNNPQILALLQSTVEDNLKEIKQQYSRKIKQKQNQLEHQLHEMKKILGVDKSQNIALLASKKQKLLQLSQMKVNAKKNKQIQIIQAQVKKQQSEQTNKIKNKLSNQFQNNIEQKKKQLQNKFNKIKLQIEKQYQQRVQKQIEQLYQTTTADKNNYESAMNKKMSQIRMKYINKIQDIARNKQISKQENIINRVMLQEKESQLENKEELIKSLERQLQLERIQWKAIIFDEELSKTLGNQQNEQLNSLLKSKMKSMGITYKSPEIQKYTQSLTNLQQRYRQDKKLLTKVLKAIQQTSAYNLYEMRKNSANNQYQNPGSGALIKKYNEDVRKMRENQQMISKYQVFLKKALLGGNNFEQNLMNLRKFINESSQYKQISLKQEIERNNFRSTQQRQKKPEVNNTNLDQLSQIEYKTNRDDLGANVNPYIKQKMPASQPGLNIGIPSSTYGSGSTVNSMQQALRQHSRFLTNVKNQLNRKLYQVRYQYRY